MSLLISLILPLAVLTAISTTVVSFLPVFTMVGEEGRLFTPSAAVPRVPAGGAVATRRRRDDSQGDQDDRPGVLPGSMTRLEGWQAARRASRLA
jgi:hypothetical protein